MRVIIAALLLTALSGASQANRVSYDIELVFTGVGNLSTGAIRTAADCTVPVNPNGYHRMVGTVTGNETAATGVDVVYYGSLIRSTKMDYCELRKTGPSADQIADCAATLTGRAVMDVDLQVHGAADRGAWLKAKPAIATHPTPNVSGACDPPEMAEIQKAYPGTATSGGGGGSPDGQPIEDKFSQVSPTDPTRGPVFFLQQAGSAASRSLPTRSSGWWLVAHCVAEDPVIDGPIAPFAELGRAQAYSRCLNPTAKRRF